MPKKEQIIANAVINIEICIQKNQSFDAHIKILATLDALDSFITVEGVKYTLLMYFAKTNNLKKIRELLETQKINRAIQNEKKDTALFIAVQCACQNNKYDTAIIDELLKEQAREQVEVHSSRGTPLFLSVISNRNDLVKKIAAVKSEKQFLSLNNGVTTALYFATEKQYQTIIDTLLHYIPEKQLLTPAKDKCLPIHCAAGFGNLTLVQTFLSYTRVTQAQLDAVTDKDALNVIACAIASNNEELVIWLFSAYPFLIHATSGPEKRTMLAYACSLTNMNTAIVKFLLCHGAIAQILTPDALGRIPLSLASGRTNEEVVKELLADDHDPASQILYIDKEDCSALSVAVALGREKNVRIILATAHRYSIGYRILFRPRLGRIILYMTLTQEYARQKLPMEILDTLLEFSTKEQLQTKDALDRNPLRFAVEENNPAAVEKLIGHLARQELLKTQLLETPSRGGTQGASSVYLAAECGFVSIVKSLLRHFPQEQLALRYKGFLPSHIACQKGHLAVVIALACIDQNHLHQLADYNESVLFTAVRYKQTMLVKTLLTTYHVDRMKPDTEGDLPLHRACHNGDSASIGHLLTEKIEAQLGTLNYAGYSPFDVAIYAKQNRCIESILKSLGSQTKKFLNTPNARVFTYLFFAAQGGSVDICKILVAYGADVNYQTVGTTHSPIHYATQYGREKVFDYLESQKADITALCHSKSSVFHIACEQGHLHLVKKFILKKMDMEQRDKWGRTCLAIAVIFGHRDIVEVLCNAGANVNVLTYSRDFKITLLWWAIYNRDLSTFKTLLEHKADANALSFIEGAEQSVLSQIASLNDPSLEKIFVDVLNQYSTSDKKNTTVARGLSEKSFYPRPPHVEKGVTGRHYLMQMGFTSDQCDDMEDERDDRTKVLKQSATENPSLTLETQGWFNGLFLSTHPEIFPIINGQNAYIYLDKSLLAGQGCNLEDLENLQFKFSHRNIKKLNKEKGKYSDVVTLPTGDTVVVYTHELKVNAVDRVLLFECVSDTKRACLYVGSRYIASGFHVGWRSEAMQTSASSNKKALAIHWPTLPVVGPQIEETKEENEEEVPQKNPLLTQSAFFPPAKPENKNTEIKEIPLSDLLKQFKNKKDGDQLPTPEIALRRAAALGKRTHVEQLIPHVNNIDAQGDESGQTALHCAVIYKHEEIARLLIDAGAQRDIPDKKENKTAETYAKENGISLISNNVLS